MKNQIILSLLVSFIGFSVSGFTSLRIKAEQGWELLGTREVKFRTDKDEIRIKTYEGTFKSIQIRVRRSAIHMHKVIIHFADGSEQFVELKNNFTSSDQSRVIDLEGNKRIIRKISLWYDTVNFKKKRAIVEVWGKH